MLTQVAVPVQVYAISHSSLYVGLVGLAGLVPIVVFGLYGGAIADAVDRRAALLLVLAADLGRHPRAARADAAGRQQRRAASSALVVVQSGAFAMASSARGAIIPRLVPTELVPAANTLNFTVGNVGQVVGPLIAGRAGRAAARLRLRLRRRRACCSPPRCTRRCGCRRSRPDGTRPEARPALGRRGAGLHRDPSGAADVASASTSWPWCWRCRARCSRQVADERFGGNVGPLYAAIAIGSVVAGLSSGWIGRVRRQGRALTFAIVGWGARSALSGLAAPAVAGGAAAGASPARPTWSARSTGRRSCRPTPRTRCAGACRACSSPSSPAARAWVTCGPAAPRPRPVADGLVGGRRLACVVVVAVAGLRACARSGTTTRRRQCRRRRCGSRRDPSSAASRGRS